MIFCTQSGSVYELDDTLGRLRRLAGSNVKNLPTNGKWRPYDAISPIRLGWRVLIAWGWELDKYGLVLRRTLTTPVVDDGYALPRADR